MSNSWERLNEKIRRNQENIDDSFARMAARNREIERAVDSTPYLPGNVAAMAREYTELSQSVEELGDNGTRGTEIHRLYRRVHGGPALPARPYAPGGPFGGAPQPALPAQPAEEGGEQRLEDAVDDWHDAWQDFRNYRIRDGNKWYNKLGRVFAKTIGYSSRALGYGVKALWRRGGLARRRRKLRKAREEKRGYLQRMAQLDARTELELAELDSRR